MIVGNKVRFRALEDDDQPLLVAWLNDPEISRLVGGFSFPASVSAQREWFARAKSDSKNQRWMVESLEGEPLGLTGLWQIDWQNRHALTALKLGAPSARGKGYGTDAIMTLMAYAFFQVGLNRLWGEILPYNLGSYKAYVERCGWRVEGVSRQHIYREGQFHDQLRVAVLKEDFLAHPEVARYTPKAPEHTISVLPEHRVTWPGEGAP
ncbi:MAG: GNAT family N-acetyltransferase [Polyangiaceae bacterium]|nr:GNAT family N-acetyltransferase [Polyangiaceae bacterium]MCW5791022.1 GNAT family N-acetyltransferase [Polyangiaceae bacterium]